MKKLAYLLCLCLCAASVFARSSVEIKADITATRTSIKNALEQKLDATALKRELAGLQKELSRLVPSHRSSSLDDGGETCDDANGISTLPYFDSGEILEETSDDYNSVAWENACGCNGSDLVYSLTIGEGALPAATYTFTTCGSYFDTEIHVFAGCPSSEGAVLVGCNDDADYDDVYVCEDDNNGLSSCVTVELSAGTYYILIEGYCGAVGDYVLTVNTDQSCRAMAHGCLETAPNISCASAEAVAINEDGWGSTVGHNVEGSYFDGYPCDVQVTSCVLWYQVTGNGNWFSATTCDERTNFDTQIHVFTGNCGELACVTANDDMGGYYDDSGNFIYYCPESGLASSVEWCTQPGVVYYIMVSGWDGRTGDFVLHVNDSHQECCTQEDYYFSADQVPFCECLSICAYQVQKIFVGPATPEQRPVATWHAGCSNRNIPAGCEQECEPASPELYMDWVYLPDYQLWCMDLVSYTSGCYCLCIDRLLPVELNSFAAVAGDGEVRIAWSTASESNVDRFEITRDGSIMSSVNAQNSATGASYAWTDENAANGTAYEYSLVVVHSDGTRQTLATETAAPQAGSALVTEYALFQNYPNPFNPSTTISFSLPEMTNVTLKVVNAIGQEVALLANGAMEAGVHTVSFDGTNLPSGIYFYTLQAGTFSAHQKMVLLK